MDEGICILLLEGEWETNKTRKNGSIIIHIDQKLNAIIIAYRHTAEISRL